ncbi:MAG: hypothetical protein AAGH65_09700 [Pseudomonadota bacterium]
MEKEPSTWVSAAGLRTVLLSILMVVVTLFWVMLVLNTNLPPLLLLGIGLLSILILSIATAWAALVVPTSDRLNDSAT